MLKVKQFIIMTLSFVVLLVGFCVPVLAIELPEGAVKGLPDGITALDNEGNDVSSDTGEYFFEVENMVFQETYSKKIQIMNLREDKAYHIYFYAEPISQEGDINLQEWCSSVIKLENKTVYTGKVTGQGNVDLTQTPIDLGLYEPGDSQTMTVDITWDQWENTDNLINYGKRLVDKNGTTVIEEASGQNYIYGETLFRWVFYAVVDEDYVPPKTGFLMSESLWYVVLSVIAFICLILAVILKKRKRS